MQKATLILTPEMPSMHQNSVDFNGSTEHTDRACTDMTTIHSSMFAVNLS
jgi:hypothetical protein